jgi:hypothetical protein
VRLENLKSSATLADLTIVWIGMQATFMQLPPNMPRSTRRPLLARSMASVFPAFPPPTIKVSK